MTPRGDDDPVLSGGSNEMRFFSAEELARLPFWRAHRPIRDALLGNGGELVVA